MSQPLKQWLWPQPRSMHTGERFAAPSAIGLDASTWHPMVVSDLYALQLPISAPSYGWDVTIRMDPRLPSQGYRLTMDAQGATLAGHDAAACFYGQLTLLQYLALHREMPWWPAVEIIDEPTYRRRGAMVDLGRTISSLPMLKQLVRVLARLRYNELHLRLYDDELCGIRFDDGPFGSENPYALSLAELAELGHCATAHHMLLVPELESWGHVGSLVYHRPELRGGEGVYGGASFLAGRESVDLIATLTQKAMLQLPNASAIHLGFDEARWYPAAGCSADYGPDDLLQQLDQVRCRLEERLGRRVELRIWADHAGRPVPSSLRGRVTLQPWQYWLKNRGMIDQAIATYGQADEPWMMCVGQSQAQIRGAYQATRYFCQHATKVANLEGLTIAMWGWNHWSAQFLTLFAGSYFAWHPQADSTFCHEQDPELFDQQVMPKLIWWQSLSDDADPARLDAARGPLVWNGRYVSGDRHGQPVASTVTAARTFLYQAYMDPSPIDNACVAPAGEVY